VGHGGHSIHGTVVHMGQDGHIAKVGHEGIRLPPQDPFDVHKGKTHHMEQDARPGTSPGVLAELVNKPVKVTPRPKVTPRVNKKGNKDSDDDLDNKDSDDDDDVGDNIITTTDTTFLTPTRSGRCATTEAKATAKAKTRQAPIKKGRRVKARRSHLYHLLPPALQKYLPNSDPNFHNYYGTVVRKTLGSKTSYDVRFDVFREREVALGLRRNVIKTLQKDEEEPDIDPRYAKHLEEEADDNDKEEKDAEEYETEKEFCTMDVDVLCSAKTFTYQMKNKKNQTPIVWKIHAINDDISDCSKFEALKEHYEEGPKIDATLNDDLQVMSHTEFFLTHMWPCMKGFAAKMNTHYEDSRAEYYLTVKDRKIAFNDPTNDDPDWKLKQAVLLIVKGSTVAGVGVEQYWQSGNLDSGLDSADFGQFMDVNLFRAISAALPYMWSDRNFWYHDRRDKPWEVFTPLIEEWNKKQQLLFTEHHLITVDESMVSWVPKGSKLGGLPNYTNEPRKPRPLGTMLKDEVKTGNILCTDPLMSPSVQDKKHFASNKSLSPEHDGTNASNPVHVAETLRQAYYAGLRPGDGWVCGDSWFGSVACCLALKLQEVMHKNEKGESIKQPMNVDSTFVVKNNTQLFPRGPLFAVLQARHPTRRTGNWVTFSTVIKGVKLVAIAYAWNNKDVAYLILTVGNTNLCEDPYVSFDPSGGFDNRDTKELPRPDIADFVFRFLSVFDVYNKVRQFSLKIEENWPTKCCWFKMMNACMGQSIVNMQHLLSYVYPGLPAKDLTVIDMAATIAKGWKKRDRKVLPRGLRQDPAEYHMRRLEDSNGNTEKQVSPKQKEKRSKGSAKQRTCFVCKKYQAKYVWSSFACPKCGTCLCNNKHNREFTSCLAEHINSGDVNLRCNGVTKVKFPATSKLY